MTIIIISINSNSNSNSPTTTTTSTNNNDNGSNPVVVDRGGEGEERGDDHDLGPHESTPPPSILQSLNCSEHIKAN